MALNEAHREDLFAEATALVQRVELTIPGEDEPVVAGRRSSGAWSIYFGGDPCYHFDATGRLRRAFVNDELYRTQGHTLAKLTRVRDGATVELHRLDLQPNACRQFLEQMSQRLELLVSAIAGGSSIILREHPGDGGTTGALSLFIGQILKNGPALAPAIPNRRN